jgi:hypothetical protein
LALWNACVSTRDRISSRLAWLAGHEDEPEFAARAALVSRSRELWERQLQELAWWAQVGVGDVTGLLLEQEGQA